MRWVLLRLEVRRDSLRFRCRTGHSSTASTLLRRADRPSRTPLERTAEVYERKGAEAETRGELVRRAVMRHERLCADTVAARRFLRDESRTDGTLFNQRLLLGGEAQLVDGDDHVSQSAAAKEQASCFGCGRTLEAP